MNLETPPESLGRRPSVSVFLLFALIGMMVYWPALNNAFVFDDVPVIANNPDLRTVLQWIFSREYFSMARETSYRPLVTVTHALDAQSGPVCAHFFSLLLHVVVGYLLYLVSLKWLSAPAAVLGGILFLIHPAWSEVVYIVSYREDLLAAVFLLCAVLAAHRQFRTLSAISFAAALFSKEAAAPLPIWIGLVSFFPAFRSCRSSLPGLIAVDVFYLFVRLSWMANPDMPLTLPNFLWPTFQAGAFAEYARLIFFPFKLNIDYTQDVPDQFFRICFGIFLAMTVIALSIRWFKSRYFLFIPLSWVAVFFLPVCNFVPLLNPFAERYLYIPMLFPCMAVAALSTQTGTIGTHRQIIKWPVACAMVAALMILAVRSHVRGYDFRDNATLFTKHLTINPRSYLMPYGMGYLSVQNNQDTDAVEWYRQTLEKNPRFHPARVAMGRSLMKLGRAKEAGEAFADAYLNTPNDPDAVLSFAVFLIQQGDTSNALPLIQHFKQLSPTRSTTDPTILKIMRH